MAKDLPYFKFFCSEWNDGDITLESYEIQGVFINVCSYYWSKECDLTKKLLYKRFRDAKETIDYLFKEGLIKLNNEHISISFLDEQFSDVESMSKTKSAAGKKSATLKKLRKEINQLCKDFSLEFKVDLTKLQHEFNTDSTDVDFLLQHISTIKIRRDNIRLNKDEDEKPQAKTNYTYIDNFIKQLSTQENQSWRETMYLQHRLRKGNLSTLLDKFKLSCISLEKNQHNSLKDFKQNFVHWLNKQDLKVYQRK